MSKAALHSSLERFSMILLATGTLVLATISILESTGQKQITRHTTVRPMLMTAALAHVIHAPGATIKQSGNANDVPQHLQVVADRQIQVTAPGKARYQFGILTPEHPAQHTFVLRNTLSAPMVIEQLMSSC